MASDFVLGQHFLAPATFHSMTMVSLGEGFSDLYGEHLDELSTNPAFLLPTGSRHFLQIDFAGETFSASKMPMNGMGLDAISQDFYVGGTWSQYRASEEKEDYDPVFRLIYSGYPFNFMPKTQLGVAVDWIYGVSEFYQPIDNWGIRTMDAMGSSYENVSEVPYDDYRLREAGDDLNVNDGYHLTIFYAHPLSSTFDIGARFTYADEAVDGTLMNHDRQDQSDYYDEYLSFYESRKDRGQDFTSRDVMLGINSKRNDGSVLGFSAGMLTGNLDRSFNERDTSNYYYFLLDQYPGISLDDSIANFQISNQVSERNWVYDGRTIYGGSQYRSVPVNGLQFRFSIYGENRQADLVESESMFRRSRYESDYFNHYDTTLSEYASVSWATLERAGTGKLEQKVYRGSGGINWVVSPDFHFFGGLYFNQSDRRLSSVEPFLGNKYARTDRSGNSYYSGTRILSQFDDKDFVWHRREQQLTFRIPVGFTYDLGEYVQISSGVSKVFRKTAITENYDAIVHHYDHLSDNNGSVTSVSDSNYVEGYRFPDVKSFDDGFDFNAGVSFNIANKLVANVSLSNAFRQDYIIKLGAQISW